LVRRCGGGSRSRVNVALGGCPFEDQMRLDICKKTQRMAMLMIRCFIDT